MDTAAAAAAAAAAAGWRGGGAGVALEDVAVWARLPARELAGIITADQEED